MMKHSLLWLALSSVCLLTGCATTGFIKLYPIQGPSAALAPPHIYDATIVSKMVDGYFTHGQLKVILENGETFQGSWENFVPSTMNAKTVGTSASYPPQENLAFAWDAIYGQGNFVAHLLGQTCGHSVMTGSHGTVLQVEFNFPRGVAIDNKGNLYKMVWQ